MTAHFPCPPAAIIFDMDGLLVDSEKLWKIAETDLLAERGRAYSDETHAPLIGLGLSDFLPGMRDAYHLSDDVDSLRVELLERLTVIIQQGTDTMPGAFEMVQFVLDHNIPYAVASSSPIDVINATLGSQPAWEGLFAVRCSADEVPKGKPAPDVYLLAAERLNVDPTQCIALEDSRNGSRAAVAAGMTCFSVPDLSHAHPDQFTEITPFVFNDLHAVRKQLTACMG